jgi:phosphate transport system substrate-binding protein
MDKKIVAGAAVLGLVIVVILFSFGSSEKRVETTTVRVSGAWALYPLMVKWADEYQIANPQVRLEVNAGGAGKGMADALGGLVDIGMISRDIDPTEVAKGAYPLAVAKDAVLPTMNKDNPVASDILRRGLVRDEFRDIFIAGNITRWGDVSGRPDVPDRISVYVRSDSCGASEIWAKYLGGKQEDLVGVGVNADPGIAQAVSNDERGMGFNNLNFAYDDKSGKPLGNLAIVPIDLNGDGSITQDEYFYSTKAEMVAAIADGRYPSPPARDLYIVTRGKPTGATRDFIAWILSDGQKYVLEQGYITLKDDALKGEAAKV